MKEIFGFDFTLNFGGSMMTSIVIFVLLFIFFLVMGIIFSKMSKRDDDLPLKGIKFLIILYVDTINKFVENNFGTRDKKLYAPYMIGITSYLAIANIASCFGLTPPLGNMGVALSLSVLAFLIFQFTGLRYQGVKERVKGFLGPVYAISPLVFPISIIGEITTPFSMGMRMFGNIFSGIVIAGLVFGFTEALGIYLGSIVQVTLITAIIHPIFDIFFGLLQMYVYFMLTTMFIKQNM